MLRSRRRSLHPLPSRLLLLLVVFLLCFCLLVVVLLLLFFVCVFCFLDVVVRVFRMFVYLWGLFMY